MPFRRRRRKRMGFRVPRRLRGRYRRSGFFGRYNGQGKSRRRPSGASNELKFNDRTIPALNPIPTNLADVAVDICRIGQNTTEQGRIGRKIVIKSIQLRIHLLLNNPTTPVHDIVRIVLLIDKQANGAIPTETNIMATLGNIGSFHQLENQGRFIFLMDEYFTMTTGGGAGNGTTNVFADVSLYIKRYFKLHLPIEYSGTVGAITEIQSNNIMLMAISHAGLAQMGVDGLTRIRYYG